MTKIEFEGITDTNKDMLYGVFEMKDTESPFFQRFTVKELLMSLSESQKEKLIKRITLELSMSDKK